MEHLTEASNELTLNSDQLLYIAEQAEKRVTAINTVMKASLKMTTHLDWVKIGGVPYLQETGSSKIASLMGVSWQIAPPQKVYDEDGSGHYVYRTSGKFYFAGRETEAMGLRSTHDEFFIGRAGNPNKPQKKPQDVNERDVMQAAYTNCLNNGIKRTIPGLRNITMEHLKESGIDISKIKGYDFNTSAPVEMSSDNQGKLLEIERMLKEMCGNDKWKAGLKKITAFKGRDGSEVSGKDDINKLSEKMIPVIYGKVKSEYEKWRENNGQSNDNKEINGGGATENQELSM